MSNNELIDKIVENVGQEKFDEIILRIYSVGVISELNFDRETIDNIILPLSQLGIIKVEDKYFPPGGRPSNGRTRYYLFSISSRKIVDSILERLNLKKIFDVFIDKYPIRLLAFIVFFLIEDNVYSKYLEEEYKNLVERMKIAQLINAFKQDVQKYRCGFLIRGFTSKNLLGSTDLILVPEFVNLLRQELPVFKIEREEKKLKLVNYIERFFLNPPINRDWYEEFLKITGEEGMQDIFEEWLKELESEEILVKGVVLQPNRLREFLNRKVEEVQEFLIAESRKEELIKEFLETLNRENVKLEEEDKVRMLSPCEDSDSFSNFISSVYKILHDQLKIKDEYIDAIRCRFHHKKTDKQQEYYEMKFKEFCESILINYPPANKDEWERLKTKIIEQAIEGLRKLKELVS